MGSCWAPRYLAVAGCLALFTLAVSAAMTGLAALAGRAGLALGAVVMFLVGNALSGIAAAPELLPQPWGAVGQWLPIGAGGTLLRSAAYFDGHGGRLAVTVLGAYAIGGLILVLIGRGRIERKTGVAPVEAAPELAGVREPGCVEPACVESARIEIVGGWCFRGDGRSS